MEDMLLSVEGLGKKYARTLRRSMKYGIQDVVAEAAGRRDTRDLRKDEFWALRDVGFELRRGQCLAVLGPNGAGKSTLLKLICGVLAPDTGSITKNGRLEKMIELSAGMSPGLSGRENVALRCRMLGLSKAVAASRLDEVVAFAELEEFIDTPVMYYSSGMKARLGFATTVVMQPDVLVIDEVLAVGDLSFRMKCYARVDEMRNGSAVVLVTHGLNHVARFGTQCLVLHKGNPAYLGSTQGGIAKYQEIAGTHGPAKSVAFHDERISVTMKVNGRVLPQGQAVNYGSEITLECEHNFPAKLEISAVLHEANGPTIADWHSRRVGFRAQPDVPFRLNTGRAELCPGTYQWVVVGIAPDGTQVFLSAPIRFRLQGMHLGTTRLQPRGSWGLLADGAEVEPAPALPFSPKRRG